jgi:type 1 fimbriae regulatory protein FimB/type 1 fimbriae regulatory protein FimE
MSEASPNAENRKVTPRRTKHNGPLHLTPQEVDQLMAAAKETGRYGHRDATMVLIAFRHGLRNAEVCALRWWQVNLDAGTVEVHRLKGGSSSTHVLHGDEIRALRRLRREFPNSDHVFVTERGGPFGESNFRMIMKRAAAQLGMHAHPHQLRHACGFSLANQGRDTRSLQAFLGHKSITNTVKYTAMSVSRFKDWKA